MSAAEVDKAPYTREEARHLTDKVKAAFTGLYEVLGDLHDRKAHLALGYRTWARYVQDEFGYTPQRVGQVLAHGRVVQAIEAAMETSVSISERARAAKVERLAQREREAEIAQRVAEHARKGRVQADVIVVPAVSDPEKWVEEKIEGEQREPRTVLDDEGGDTFDDPELHRTVSVRALEETAGGDPMETAVSIRESVEEPVRPVQWSGLVHQLNVSRAIRVETKGLPHQDVLRVVLHALEGGLTEEEVGLLLNRVKAQNPAAAKAWAARLAMGS